MEEMINKLVENTLKKDNAKEIIVDRISWYEMELKKKEDTISKAIEYMEIYMFSQKENYDYIHLLDILKGVDKE